MFKKLNRLFSIVTLLMLISAWFLFRFYTQFSPSPQGTPAILNLTIDKGEGIADVSNKLADLSQANQGSLSQAEIMALSYITAGYFKPGDYEFPNNASLSQILNKLKKGEISPHQIRLPEGATWRDIQIILSKAELSHDMQSLDVTQAAQLLNTNAKSIEGMLFPDTYQYRKNEPESSLLTRAHKTLLQRLNEQWLKRDENLPYANPYEALIMASIIEKETGLASDRPMIASVFINRLKTPMRLQTDPTVIYGMGSSFNGNLTKANLQQDTPFNTYTRNGLTPTPIATASLASINAALHPANSSALYFVARGDGSSEFSETLAQHNAAVQKYQLINSAK